MSSPPRRRLAAAAGLLVSLAGPPLLLWAMAGPPGVAGLSWWELTAGLRYQSLPVELLLSLLGVFAWALWGYAALATVLRVVAVLATRRGMSGSARLLAFTNLFTVAPVRALVDAAVGVSLLASAPHAVAALPTFTDPPAVVRTMAAPAGWEHTASLLGAVHTDTDAAGPAPAVSSQALAPAAEPAVDANPECRAETSHQRLYTVTEGDSLWRIAERELGDGHRWRDIFIANQGRRMGDGQLLRDPMLIRPGRCSERMPGTARTRPVLTSTQAAPTHSVVATPIQFETGPARVLRHHL